MMGRRGSADVFRHFERYQETFVDIGKGFVWGADLNFKYTYVNPSVEQVLGLTVDDMMGRDALEGMPYCASEVIERLITTDAWRKESDCKGIAPVLTFGAEQSHKNGSRLQLRISVTVCRDIDGNPIGTIGASREVDYRENAFSKPVIDHRAFEDAVVERTVALMRVTQELEMEAARRSLLEAGLKESERRYRFLFEEAPMAITEEDRSECKRYC